MVYSFAFSYIGVALVQGLLDQGGVLVSGQRASLWTQLTFHHDRPAVWDGEYWRLMTSTFLHGGIWHLSLNVLCLIILGRDIERWLGAWRFLGTYLLCLFSGAVFFQALSGEGVGVGASGGICGIAGLFVTRMLRRGPRGPLLDGRFWIVVAVAVGLLLADGIVGGLILRGVGWRHVEVAVSAHFGGFTCGMFLGYLAQVPRGEAGQSRRLAAVSLLGGVLCVSGVYGFAYPVFDFNWYVWKGRAALRAGDEEAADAEFRRAREIAAAASRQIIDFQLEVKDLDRALESWRSWWRTQAEEYDVLGEVGYFLYEHLALEDRVDDSESVLDDLIALTDAALDRDRSPILLNSAAWYRAMRGTELEIAEKYAQDAYRRDPRGFILNTLGWVRFLLGKHEKALRNLEDAAAMERVGPHCLYLALAYRDLGEFEKSRRAVGNARRLRYLTPLETKMLDVLSRELEARSGDRAAASRPEDLEARGTGDD